MFRDLLCILPVSFVLAAVLGAAEPAPAAPPPPDELDVLHEYVNAAIGTLDPAHANDLYANRAISQVCDTLLEYHYLKRPFTLQPSLAAAMPEASDDRLTYTIKIKQGVVYADDPCFPGGKGRALVAADFAYAWKRLADSATTSPGWWIFDEKIVGLNEFREKSADENFRKACLEKAGQSDGVYLAEVEGISTPDDHTLVIKLTAPSPQFLYFLAMPFTCPIAPEAIRKYGAGIASHPVGTGPYTVESFDGNSKVVYVANPSYREVLYPTEGAAGDAEKGLLKDAGKRLPLTKRVELNVVVEDLPRWLEFAGGKFDRYEPTHEFFDKMVGPDRNGLTAEFGALGMQLAVYPEVDVTYAAFNMEDPLFKENVYLRRAMSLAWDAEQEIRELRNGRAIPAVSPIPPGLFGYDADRKSPYRRPDDMPGALELAKKLMTRAGYPDGKGLPVLSYASNAGTPAAWHEQFTNCMKKIGVEFKIEMKSWPEFDAMIRGKRGQVWGVAWGADYPDCENFLQLLYGPNESPGPNGSNYKNARYDELYPQMVSLPNGPERQKVIDEMVEIVQRDCPWIFQVHRQAFIISQGWLRNYKYMGIGENTYRYYGVDVERKRELQGRFK